VTKSPPPPTIPRRFLPARVGTPARAVLVALVVATLGALTVARNRTWRDEGAFYAAQLASAPGSAAAWHNAAIFRYERRELAQAIEHERRALAILPDFHHARNALAVALAESGRLADARREFAELVRREPRYTRGHFGLGQTLQLLGRRDEARAAFERALALDPGHLPSRVKLAELLAQAGQFAQARDELARALERDPAYAPALRLQQQLQGR
jgi:tetratricopeptide (TPR) repeat protein